MRKIIGYLMSLANREGMKELWYPLKDKLCTRFGVNDGYDVQYLQGILCHTCDGTGIFKKYSYYGSGFTRENCWHCDSRGWYKKSCYVLLERKKVGSHVFHKPIRREYTIKTIFEVDIPATVTIEGYIRHTKHKHGWLALYLLFILFDWKAYRTLVKGMGRGWRVSWWKPRNYLNNIIHICRYTTDAIPIRSIKNRKTKKNVMMAIGKYATVQNVDDLPF